MASDEHGAGRCECRGGASTSCGSRAVPRRTPVYNEIERFSERARRSSSRIVQTFGAGSDSSSSTMAARTGPPISPYDFADHPIVRVICREHEGKGAAVRVGLASARAPYAAFCDIDLSTPLDDLGRVIKEAVRTGGLVIGSRAVGRSSARPAPTSFLLEGLGRAYNQVLRATLVDGVHDTQCGAKAASALVWRRILACSRERGFAWDVEAVAIAQRLDIPVHEVAVNWANDERTRVRGSSRRSPSCPRDPSHRSKCAFDQAVIQHLASSTRHGRRPSPMPTPTTGEFRSKAVFVRGCSRGQPRSRAAALLTWVVVPEA